ncbi:hypothetical protein [Candidatus Palauibacter sp.]|uniref:hypothetical protein n=1 Tax=Candidatus Palauibacter sp. TaxID=3101350 RepID=UPI003D0BC583
MTELIPSPCEECEYVEYGLHYYVIDALVRKIARDSGDPLPKAGTGYYGDRAEAIMFEALVEMIASGSGRGIHNCDHGHPTYYSGANGRVELGDSPEENDLFRTLQRFNRKHHEEIRDVSTWRKFCELVISSD